MPFARYHPTGDDRFEVEAGFPASTPTSGEGEVEPSDLPGGLAAVTVHTGPYDTIGPTYEALRAWVQEHGGEPVGDAWEVYLTEPDDATRPGSSAPRSCSPTGWSDAPANNAWSCATRRRESWTLRSRLYARPSRSSRFDAVRASARRCDCFARNVARRW